MSSDKGKEKDSGRSWCLTILMLIIMSMTFTLAGFEFYSVYNKELWSKDKYIFFSVMMILSSLFVLFAGIGALVITITMKRGHVHAFTGKMSFAFLLIIVGIIGLFSVTRSKFQTTFKTYGYEPMCVILVSIILINIFGTVIGHSMAARHRRAMKKDEENAYSQRSSETTPKIN